MNIRNGAEERINVVWWGPAYDQLHSVTWKSQTSLLGASACCGLRVLVSLSLLSPAFNLGTNGDITLSYILSPLFIFRQVLLSCLGCVWTWDPSPSVPWSAGTVPVLCHPWLSGGHRTGQNHQPTNSYLKIGINLHLM